MGLEVSKTLPGKFWEFHEKGGNEVDGIKRTMLPYKQKIEEDIIKNNMRSIEIVSKRRSGKTFAGLYVATMFAIMNRGSNVYFIARYIKRYFDKWMDVFKDWYPDQTNKVHRHEKDKIRDIEAYVILPNHSSIHFCDVSDRFYSGIVRDIASFIVIDESQFIDIGISISCSEKAVAFTSERPTSGAASPDPVVTTINFDDPTSLIKLIWEPVSHIGADIQEPHAETKTELDPGNSIFHTDKSKWIAMPVCGVCNMCQKKGKDVCPHAIAQMPPWKSKEKLEAVKKMYQDMLQKIHNDRTDV